MRARQHKLYPDLKSGPSKEEPIGSDDAQLKLISSSGVYRSAGIAGRLVLLQAFSDALLANLAHLQLTEA